MCFSRYCTVYYPSLGCKISTSSSSITRHLLAAYIVKRRSHAPQLPREHHRVNLVIFYAGCKSNNNRNIRYFSAAKPTSLSISTMGTELSAGWAVAGEAYLRRKTCGISTTNAEQNAASWEVSPRVRADPIGAKQGKLRWIYKWCHTVKHYHRLTSPMTLAMLAILRSFWSISRPANLVELQMQRGD